MSSPTQPNSTRTSADHSAMRVCRLSRCTRLPPLRMGSRCSISMYTGMPSPPLITRQPSVSRVTGSAGRPSGYCGSPAEQVKTGIAESRHGMEQGVERGVASAYYPNIEPVPPEDQRTDTFEHQHDGHGAGQNPHHGPRAGEAERTAHRQAIQQRNAPPQQAQGEHDDDDKPQAAKLHQQQDHPLPEARERCAGGDDGQSGDGRRRSGRKKGIHKADRLRRHPWQQQQSCADADQRRQCHQEAEWNRHVAFSLCAECFLGHGIKAAVAAQMIVHGSAASCRSCSRSPTTNSVSSCTNLVSGLGFGSKCPDRWMRSTLAS